jgi:hypothetical protein
MKNKKKNEKSMKGVVEKEPRRKKKGVYVSDEKGNYLTIKA